MKNVTLVLKIFFILVSIWCLAVSFGPALLVALFKGTKDDISSILKLTSPLVCILLPIATIIYIVALRYVSLKTGMILSLLPALALVVVLAFAPLFRESVKMKFGLSNGESDKESSSLPSTFK